MTTFEQQVDNVKAGKRISRNIEDLLVPEQYTNYSIKQAIYLAANNLKDSPKCNCGAELKFVSCQAGYFNSCNSCRVKRLNQYASENNRSRNIDRSIAFRNSISDQINNSLQDYGLSLKTVQQISIEHGVGIGILNTYISKTTIEADRKARGAKIRSQKTKLVFQQPFNKLLDKDWIDSKIDIGWCAKEFAEFLNIHKNTVCVFLRKQGYPIQHNNSSGEMKVKQLLDDLSIDYIHRSRSIISPKELDFFIPSANLAIEVNGLYWHSDDRINKNYHSDKTSLCLNKNIHLMHFWEHELCGVKREIVNSMILNRIGKSKVIGARKLHITNITHQQANQFFCDNHIQGFCRSSFCNIALVDDQFNILACMSFSKSRFKSNYQYELLRYCNLLNTSVVGAASRLLKSFIKQHNPKSIVSYSQVRLFDGNVYQQMGFKLSHRAAPGYFWWINKSGIHIKSRHQTQVHKLIADENNKSERAIMVRDGYRRVWDCGNDVWCYNLT